MKVRNLIHLRFDVHDPIQLLLQPASQVPILLSLAAAIGCGRQLVTTSFAFFFLRGYTISFLGVGYTRDNSKYPTDG